MTSTITTQTQRYYYAVVYRYKSHDSDPIKVIYRFDAFQKRDRFVQSLPFHSYSGHYAVAADLSDHEVRKAAGDFGHWAGLDDMQCYFGHLYGN